MVRVPGSLSDSGFHRESLQEDAQEEFGQGNDVSTEIGSPLTPLKQDRSAERRSFGRGSTDGTEEGPATDLEEKPRPPPQVPSGTPVGLDTHLDPPDESPPAQAGVHSSTQPLGAKSTAKKKSSRSKSSRKKMKAPDSDADDCADLTLKKIEDELAVAYYKKELYAFLIEDVGMQILRPKIVGDLRGPVSRPSPGSNKLDAAKALLHLLKEADIVAGSFTTGALFDLELSEIEHTSQSLFALLKPLVGEVAGSQEHPISLTPKSARPTTTPARSTPAPSPGDQTAMSSPYVSATEEVDSDSANDSPRMTLGPSGAAMLRDRAKRAATSPTGSTKIAVVDPKTRSPEKLESFFQSAMERFLKEQQAPQACLKPSLTEDQDVEMESVESPPRFPPPGEYDPDDLDLGQPARAAIATTTTTTPAAKTSTGASRLRVSAMSELKEFSGKDGDEDRARSWVGKVKSAFIRDQAPDKKKCLVFGDLLTGPARNWYRQLSRTTRSTWKDLFQSFQVQYCGRGVSVARQYYHARKRSDESPLEYLHRLNVAGLRARIQVKDGPSEIRREHVDHFIETLDDRDLADQLALLRVPDADTLEEVLRSRQRSKARQSKTVYGSVKPRQKTPAAAGARAVRAVQVQADSSESEIESEESDDDGCLRRVYVAAAENHGGSPGRRQSDQDRSGLHQDRDLGQNPRSVDMGAPSKRCSHCGSRKHDDLGCWKRLTCEKCGKRGHPSDRCLFVCKACGEIHDAGTGPMEEFYNLIRQWYNPTKHGGMLPESVEKMLNQDARRG
ncbi:hypothetical protein PF008_g23539 [Phytophthora fragariae]|uniref:CCHC-type domain-containing protein n=1 Tax=Phytophthora fragariae TaxID=53985 RepID=A0A6G0QR57_9STRA|nr:hypothetical protein PF008_g23539 [Phytophthora fragariae]